MTIEEETKEAYKDYINNLYMTSAIQSNVIYMNLL